MGHIFQDEWWAWHPSGCLFGWLWLKKLAKEMAKALKRQKGILAHLFMKIMEIRRKSRWMVISFMWGEKRRKIMENEENRGLIHKKASKDQLVTFFTLNFGALSLLSLSDALGHLESLGAILALEQER